MPGDGPSGGVVHTSEGQKDAYFDFKPNSTLVYIATDDIDATLAKAESLGGKTVLPKTEIPGFGWFGILSEPTGNYIGLYTQTGQ